MSESVTDESFDVEAQECLLQGEEETSAAAEDQVSDHQLETSSSSATTKIFMRALVLLVHSLELFKLGSNDNHEVDSPSNSTRYSAFSSTNNSEDIILIDEDARTVAAIEISEDITGDQNVLSLHSASELKHNIELQCIQRNNITKIVKDKNLQALQSFGGVRRVTEALNTDVENGISGVQEYIWQYKRNQQSQVSIFLHSFLGALNNYTIILLLVAAALSLTFGIKEQGLTVEGWIDGVIVIGTIFIIILIKTVHSYLQERTYVKNLETYRLSDGRGGLLKGLHSSCSNLKAQVTRAGNQGVVSAIDIRVGDLVHLKKGSIIPADGIYVAGESLQVDGELKSTTIDETNPFLFYGSRVINGNASMIVTSVGVDMVWGEMMSQAVAPPENKCKFAACFCKVNTYIQITGILIGILINTSLFVRYVLGKKGDDNGFKTDTKSEPTQVIAIMDAIKGMILGSKLRTTGTIFSVSLVGIMEGIPVVISLAVFIWNHKTLIHKALVRDYLSSIKMATITIICTDKLGGLSEYEQEIDKFLVGEEFISESSQVACPDVLEGLCDGIGTLLLIPPIGCESKVVPIISWAEDKIGLRKGSINEQCKILKMYGIGGNPFEENCGVVMEKIGLDGRSLHLHYKGPPLEILSLSSEYYDSEGNIQAIDVQKRRKFENVIRYNLAGLEVVAFACRRIANEFDDESVLEANSLTLLGMIALKYTQREEIREAVLTLNEGGIRTILASGDDVAVLQTIGENCGLISPNSDDLVLTAEEYRAWTDEEKRDRVGKICVIGNCLQSDKIDLLKCLKKKDEVVALLGQRTLDAPALKVADIGLTFGSWSSEVARECSGISIFYGDFSFLVHLIKKGKSFHDNTRKFIQLQLIFFVSSLLINFIATVLWGDAPLTTIQLFWLNLVLVFDGGLAVLTGQPIGVLMDIVPIKSCGQFITKAMYRNIFIQAFYQTTVLLTLQYKGQSIFGISGAIVKSMIYMGFCFCQFFNIFIAREPKSIHIFKGLFQKNVWFFVALVIFLLSQAAFLVAEKFLGGTPFLSCKLFGLCFLIGLVCWLLDFVGKLISSFIINLASG